MTKHVLITGTTSGIGRALVEYYAARGIDVTAVNRRTDPGLQKRYPSVHFRLADVRDTKAIRSLMSELIASERIPDLLILNAGINRVDNEDAFNPDEFRTVMETNLLGALEFVAPLTSVKPEFPAVTVVAISSMTNYAANPYCLGYYISKRALTQTFEVLEEMYRNTPLRFKWVVLGPVATEIVTSGNKFPKYMLAIKNLFSASLENTARTIASFSESRRRRLIYPFPARVLFKSIQIAQLILPGFYRGRKKTVRPGS